jgi:hypothetical protein
MNKELQNKLKQITRDLKAECYCLKGKRWKRSEIAAMRQNGKSTLLMLNRLAEGIKG